MKEEKDLRKSEHIQMDDYCNRSFYSRYCVSLLDDTNVYKCKRVSLRNSFDQLTDCFERQLFHGQYIMYGPKCKKNTHKQRASRKMRLIHFGCILVIDVS